jgi:ribokinase
MTAVSLQALAGDRPGQGPRVVVLGSANMDLVATAGSLPTPGETVLGHGFTMIPGGKGANQAIAAARAGGRCAVIGAVGDDAFGGPLRGGLREAGVDTGLLRMAGGPSGVALIVVDDAGENQIVVSPGANATVTGLTGPDRAAIAAADALICQLEVPVEAVIEAAVAARAAGTRVVVNAAPARVLPGELLAATDLLVVNQGEAGIVTGLTPAIGSGELVDELVDALVGLVPRAVLTLGAAGAVYGERAGDRLAVPAPKVSTVDTTAAGDAFIGALTVAWLEQRPMPDAVRWACAAGAACARTLGAANSLPTRTQIDELYRSTYQGEPV